MRVSVLSVLLATWMRSVFGITIEIYPPSPRVNQTVILNVIDVRSAPLLIYADWYKGETADAEFQIIRFNQGGPTNFGKGYFAEADVFKNGSLQIRNAQKVHEGFYTVNVQTDGAIQAATVRLMLEDPSGGLSGGAIAGITIAVIAVVSGVTGVIVYVFKKKNNSSDLSK